MIADTTKGRVLGIVAAGHPATAAAGVQVLRAGGNAADAAVAASCAAMTAEAALTGVGGGGFALVSHPDGRAELLDFFTAAPGKGRSPHDLAGRQVLAPYVVPFRGTTQLFNVGPSSCAVPGMMPGLAALHERHGRLPLSQVLLPAVELARSGALMVPEQEYLHEILSGLLTGNAGMRAIFAPAGRLARAGETLLVPGLAATLEAFGREGAKPFTHGTFAQRMAAGLEESAGLITTQDLAAYSVLSREPVALRYRDYDILSNPLPSSGGTLIAFSLGLLDRVPLGGVDPVSLALSLAWALARTDQARDDLFNVGMREAGFADQFLSPATLDRYATPPPAEPQLRRPRPSAGGTTHISAIDSEGVAVALTSSCGSGSGVIIEGTGIIMNNMGGEEDLNPGGPFSLPPGERLTSMMAPTIARRADGGLLALGSAGSARLRSAIVQTLVNVIDRGFLASDAVNAPRLHVDRGTVQLEGGTPVEVARAAEDAGYPVNLWPVLDLYFGGVQIAARSESGSRSAFDGAGDPRRGGVALLA